MDGSVCTKCEVAQADGAVKNFIRRLCKLRRDARRRCRRRWWKQGRRAAHVCLLADSFLRGHHHVLSYP